MRRTTRMTRRPSARRPEGGFALLVVFLMAAAVAFTMYEELPRAAFESVRDKEQLLTDRGNQYRRAIQVFYAENKRYPAELKDLETTGTKRYLRRRYIDPMTGKDEWRLVHTNGSFLTDSLVQKPPAQNAANGLPGQGQTPGGGPLGANNLNTASSSATDAPSNPNDPAAVAAAPALNPMAMQRPADRRFPSGPGFPQPPGSNPGAPGVGSPNSFGMNSAAYDPSDPRTWPAITVATPTGQPGQQQQMGTVAQPGRGNPPFGGMPSGGGTYQPMPAQFGGGAYQPMPAQFGAVPTQIQGNIAPGNIAAINMGLGNMGQGNGQGGGNPQPSTVINPNPLDPAGLVSAPIQNDNQNAPPFPVNPNNPNGQFPPVGMQTMPAQQQPQSQVNAQIAANLQTGGFNSQVPPSPQANPALPGNNSSNPALNAIDNALFRPNQAPVTGPNGSPGIAGVATKFKGPSIKSYRKRTKYQEWEFVYEPVTNQPGVNQPGANPLGPSQPGQAGAAGQNPQQAPGPFGPSSGSAPGGAAPSNSFSMPNPFGPSAAPQQ